MAHENFRWWDPPVIISGKKMSLKDFCFQDIESADKIVQMEEEPEIRRVKSRKLLQ